MTEKEVYMKISELFGEFSNTTKDLEAFQNELHANITQFFVRNPDHKVKISANNYRRLHDGNPHTWDPWDWIGDVMVNKKMTRYIKWVD